MNDDLLSKAIVFAARAHAGQQDKGGDPYFWHVLRVGVSLLPDAEAAVVGVLHDVLEDSHEYGDELQSLVTDDQYRALLQLTRLSGESYDGYIRNLIAHGSPLVRKVKLADLEDNLLAWRLAKAMDHGFDVVRLVGKYVKARIELMTIDHAPATSTHPLKEQQ